MNSETTHTGVTLYKHIKSLRKRSRIPRPLNNRGLRRRYHPRARLLRKRLSFSSSALEATLSACY